MEQLNQHLRKISTKPKIFLDMLAEVGINMEMVTHTLQVDGVEKICNLFQKFDGSN